MASRLLLCCRLTGLLLAALTMSTLACQPIVEEPDAGPPVNHPPRIVEGFAAPPAVVVDLVQASNNCTEPINFSLGKVEDPDIDQTLQERWTLDYDPAATAQTFQPYTLQRVPNAPSFATDQPDAFQIRIQDLRDKFAVPSLTVVDVFVSDGFDDFQAGPTKVTAVLPGRYVVRRSWVLSKAGACPP